ncbi:glycosyltransferase family 9 protein [Parapedobacter koreensis]|uniref:ADP-heptose:LPS heptosyltransferase n=1 Tax=Parapedobacter koreensis TaxID=332977 RepID=A0A1H7P0I5_9SPHI|nr:glycosyltransferase family 9 protein [Parapedobacter koreensis]SEL29146.1 ADP-heptose:LPS heptosyltransferase [Parapedobacter koreensis]
MQLEKINKIAIFRALQLGDLLCFIPAIRALRRHLPQASITLVGLPWAEQLVQRFPMYFDAFERFPGYPGLPEQPYTVQDMPHFLARMQAGKFDLALQMQGDGTLVNPLVELFGATYTAGFYTEASYRPPGEFFIPYPSHVHEVCRHLLLMQHLGIPHQGLDLEFPVTEEDYAAFETLGLPIQPGEYVCIHPGSRAAWRQWPPVAFANMADKCAALGYEVVITGTADEIPTVTQVAQLMHYTPIIAAGKTSLGALAVLIKQAKAILSNCTGTSHLASALGTPGVIISMDGEPSRWRPINKSALVTIDWIQTPDLRLVEDTLVSKLTLPLAIEHYLDSV